MGLWFFFESPCPRLESSDAGTEINDDVDSEALVPELEPSQGVIPCARAAPIAIYHPVVRSADVIEAHEDTVSSELGSPPSLYSSGLSMIRDSLPVNLLSSDIANAESGACGGTEGFVVLIAFG